MFLRVAELKEGTNVRVIPITATSKLDYHNPDLVSVGNGTLTLTIRKYQDTLFVDGRVEIGLILRCARCLEHFPYNLTENFEFGVKLKEKGVKRVELWEKDLVEVDKNGEIDLAKRVRDAIFLAIPTFPLCSEDCKGLCPICGANLNKGSCQCQRSEGDLEDSPFSKLGALLHKKRSKNATS